MENLKKLISLRQRRLKVMMSCSIFLAIFTIGFYILLGFVSDVYAIILICLINTISGSAFFMCLKNYRHVQSWIKWAKEYPNVAKKHFHIPTHYPEQTIIRLAILNAVIAAILLW